MPIHHEDWRGPPLICREREGTAASGVGGGTPCQSIMRTGGGRLSSVEREKGQLLQGWGAAPHACPSSGLEGAAYSGAVMVVGSLCAVLKCLLGRQSEPYEGNNSTPLSCLNVS